MKVADTFVVVIDSLDHQGRGIAHIDNQVIFVFGALVGEKVEISITKVKKKIAEAKVIKMLSSSNERVESPCMYFGKCGGCDLLHMAYLNQLKYKENKVKEILKKFAGIEGVVKPIIASSNIFEYRNKVVFQVDKKIGFYQKQSNQIIEINSCLLLNEKMNNILKMNMNLDGIRQIMVRYSEALKESMILFDVTNDFKESQIPTELLKQYSVIVKKKNEKKIVSGNSYLLEKINDMVFKISPESFFQVNTKQMEKLYQTVLDYSDLTGKENVLDLYCGTGTIGIFLSKYAKKVLGIEINKSAIEDALWNKRENHIENIEFICGDTKTVLTETSFQSDLVVVDPPRAGLDEQAVLEIQKIEAKKIIYVSCDPVTLARDIKRLEKEYQVTTVIPVDMFSNTYHVECVCVLDRK